MHGFTREFVQSGDLRAFLAMSPPESPNQKLFQTFAAMDDLIVTVSGGPQPMLSYNAKALQARDAYRKKLLQFPGFTTVEGSQNLAGMFRGGTCVLVGSSGSLDVKVVHELAASGVVVMALGNAVKLVKEPSIWVGAQDILTYLPTAFERQATMAFVKKNMYTELLWDPQTKRQIQKAPKDFTNTWGYNLVEDQPIDTLGTVPRVTTFGTNTTIAAAISLAAVLGFQDILLYAIDLGGPLDKYYAFPEIPHSDTVSRKSAGYAKLREVFPAVYKAYASACIRIAAIEKSPFTCPIYSMQYLKQTLSSVMAMSRRTEALTARLSTPAMAKRTYVQMLEKHRQAIVSPVHVIDNLAKFIEVAPDLFNTPEIKAAEEAIKSASCSGCAKNKHAKPAYEVFEKAIVEGEGRISAAWAKILPDKYIVKPNLMRGGDGIKMIFRADHKQEQAEYDRNLI